MFTRWLFIFAACVLVIGAVYRGVPSNFMRAESGWYLVHSHADAEARRAATAELVRYSFNGHYTPLAFLAEFQVARWIGTNGTLWRARQILALGVAVALVFAFSSAIARRAGIPRAASLAIGVALGASVAFQPAMFDFVSWPFMVLQLLWIACAAIVMNALVRFGWAPAETGWLAIAAVTAYGALHISGLGLVLVGATAAVGAGILLMILRDRRTRPSRVARRIATMLGLMLALTALHVWLTVRLDYAPAPAVPGQLAPARLQLLLGFVWQFAVAGTISFLPLALKPAHGSTFGYVAVLGFALLIALAAATAVLWRRAAAPQDRQAMTSFVLHTFSISAFCLLVALVVLRVRTAGLPTLAGELANFTWGPRYVIPLHTTLLGSALAASLWFGRRIPRAATATFTVLAIAATFVAAQPLAAKKLSPQAMISHDLAWRLLLETVRECRAQRLPVPDVPLGALGQEFAEISLRSVEPLVRHDLQLPGSETIDIIPWGDYASGERHRYRAVPALKRLERKLGLLPENSP